MNKTIKKTKKMVKRKSTKMTKMMSGGKLQTAWGSELRLSSTFIGNTGKCVGG